MPGEWSNVDNSGEIVLTAASSAHLRDVAAGYRTRQENVVDILHVDGHRLESAFWDGNAENSEWIRAPPW